jgi:hypothetical protein
MSSLHNLYFDTTSIAGLVSVLRGGRVPLIPSPCPSYFPADLKSNPPKTTCAFVSWFSMETLGDNKNK